jgi:hypothetical protein
VLITVCDPEITIEPDALTPNVDVAWLRTSLPLPVSLPEVPIFNALQCMMTLASAVTSMSPADSILTTLFAESMTILFFFVLSTIVIFSAPSLSSKMIR